MEVPGWDVPAYNGWSEQDRTLYRALPFFLVKLQIARKNMYSKYAKMASKRKWTPNMGEVMRGIRTNPSPHLRQFAEPNLLKNTPKKDVTDVRETEQDAQIYRHRFESQAFNFFPDFNNFMSHIQDTGKDIMQKIERFEELFLRGFFWHCAPYVFVCKDNGSVELVKTTPWSGNGTRAAGEGKTTAIVTDLLGRTTGPLGMRQVAHMATIAENDLGVPFHSGSDIQFKEDEPLKGKYALHTSSEAFFNWTFDPYLKENKALDVDVVTASFKGSLFGKILSSLESHPLRFKADATTAAPELRSGDNDNFDLGGTNPNPEYAEIAPAVGTGSPFEVGFFCGPNGYESIEVGAPPKEFTKDEMPHNFPAMSWNAQVRLTKQFLIDVINGETGLVEKEQNTYGEWVKFIAQGTFGCLPVQRRNIIPVVYKRQRVGVAA